MPCILLMYQNVFHKFFIFLACSSYLYKYQEHSRDWPGRGSSAGTMQKGAPGQTTLTFPHTQLYIKVEKKKIYFVTGLCTQCKCCNWRQTYRRNYSILHHNSVCCSAVESKPLKILFFVVNVQETLHLDVRAFTVTCLVIKRALYRQRVEIVVSATSTNTEEAARVSLIKLLSRSKKADCLQPQKRAGSPEREIQLLKTDPLPPGEQCTSSEAPHMHTSMPKTY